MYVCVRKHTFLHLHIRANAKTKNNYGKLCCMISNNLCIAIAI